VVVAGIPVVAVGIPVVAVGVPVVAAGALGGAPWIVVIVVGQSGRSVRQPREANDAPALTGVAVADVFEPVAPVLAETQMALQSLLCGSRSGRRGCPLEVRQPFGFGGLEQVGRIGDEMAFLAEADDSPQKEVPVAKERARELDRKGAPG